MREGSYNCITFKAATKLLNTATAPQALNGDQYAQAIVNMLPTKGGTLAIRNGTAAIGSVTDDGSSVIELMPYVSSDGTQQTLTYTDNGKIKKYVEGTDTWSDLKTGLNVLGVPYFTPFEQGGNPFLVIVNGFDNMMQYDGTVITDVSEYVADNGTSKTWVDQDTLMLNTGTRGNGDYPNGRSVRVTFNATGIAITSITRSSNTATVTTTANHNLATGTYVTITGAAQTDYNGTFQITNTAANTFTYAVANTPVTPATGSPVYSVGGAQNTSTVSSRTLSGQVLTVNFNSAVFPAASVTITAVEYQNKAGVFSFIFAAQDRLWALTKGELKPETFRDTVGRGYVYFSGQANVIGSWYNSVTQELGFFDTANKMRGVDELIAINEIDGVLALFGRKNTLLYSGTDPADATAWAWEKTIPVGVVQGKLIQQLPSDVAFVSTFGIQSLRTVYQNAQVQATPDIGSAIDPTTIEEVQALVNDPAMYKGARSFFYPSQGIFGFKIATKLLVLKINEEAKGWVIWQGDFTDATAFVTLPDGRLMFAISSQLAVFSDGKNGTSAVYSDRDLPISWAWWTPWMGGTKRWANHSFEILHNDANQIDFEIVRLKDNSLGFQSASSFTTSVPIALWDTSFWDAANWDIGGTVIPKKRDKFVALTFSFIIRGTTSVGPFEIVAIQAFGQWER